MYEIRQFRPALYTLIILGITEFALATQSLGIWVLAVGAVLLNGWLVKNGLFRPLPRLVANAVTVLLFVAAALQVRAEGLTRAVLIAGQFLVFLQLVKLFEQRANRDYAQLLVLSLLLVVAASISTASLAFGMLLIVYLFLSLYCCLLFHLKVETDQAKELISVPDAPLTRGKAPNQPLLSKSMRRLTVAISLFSLVIAVAVFLFFPRTTGASLLSALQFQNSQTLTGFSDEVNFQTVAKITQSDEVVAHVSVTKDGKPWVGQQPLLLRGITLSTYNGGGAGWQWTRNVTQEDSFREGAVDTDITADAPRTFVPMDSDQGLYRQEISLQPTGTAVLFAMPGIVSMQSERDNLRVRYFPDEEAVQTIERLTSPVKYVVVSRGNLLTPKRQAVGPMRPAPPPPTWGSSISSRVRDFMRQAEDSAVATAKHEQSNDTTDDNSQEQADANDDASSTPRHGPIDPRIEAYARRPEVSGTNERGPLAEQRPRNVMVSPLDAQIASNIEHYLQQNFEYTLDLTDAKRIEGQDPMVSFLYDLKRGHCEYFAGAMTLMCQSLGMQARMVVGFKCDEYNDLGHYYVVRQSHAHAWVEVKTPDGWETFDPTSGRGADTVHEASAFEKLKHFFDFLEYTWANSVVAYNRDSRQNIVNNTERALVNTAISGTSGVAQVKSWLKGNWFSADSPLVTSLSRVLTWLVTIGVIVIVLAIVWYVWDHLKLRRRARRIGLDTLPAPDRVRLARQLGFYDEMLRLLEKHKIVRPPHLTPMEFSRSITFLPSSVYDMIQRVTHLFYRVRYGGAELTPAQQAHLTTTIERIEQALAK